ncbi:hypothetical protein AB9K35_02060 [Leisingera sp. XS_AS12]|uniref:hypothetical protein n=1 Tax=Leisingera sp. XS_AS12 TaxID=3241294 RepID=UPI0035118C24
MIDELTVPEQHALSRVAPRLLQAWKLNDDECVQLLRLTTEEWDCLKNDQPNSPLGSEQMQRVAVLIGVHAALMRVYSGDISRVARWIAAKNSGAIMNGRKPIEAMLQGGLPTMLRIRRLLQAEVAG